MELTNRHGTPVDPVPFLVVAITGLLVSYVYFPGYFLALGASVPLAVTGATMVATVVCWWAYYRYCWSMRPDLRREVPSAVRFHRIVYGMGILAGILVLLAIPLLL